MRFPAAFASATVVVSLALALAGVGAAAAPVGPLQQAEGDVTWSVQPANTVNGTRTQFEYSTDPGTQVVDYVVVSNRGTTAAEFSIYATDATNDVETGDFGLLPSNEPPTDMGAWITMDVDSVTLEPGQASTIPFNLLIPSDATPGDHVAGIIASITTTADDNGTTVNLEQRVGARVYLRVSGDVSASAEISGVSTNFTPELNPFAFGRLTLDYAVRNTGNVRMDVVQEVQITGPFGIPLATITPQPLVDLLPRQTVGVSADVPQIAALFLAFSTITVTPGPLGSAETPAIDDSETAIETATPEPTDAHAELEPTAAPPIDASNLDDRVDFIPVSTGATTLTISWTLLLLVVIIGGVVLLAIRYVSNTREQMYAAIDEAAAAAREEALATANKANEK
jgi:hypothetical protein